MWTTEALLLLVLDYISLRTDVTVSRIKTDIMSQEHSAVEFFGHFAVTCPGHLRAKPTATAKFTMVTIWCHASDVVEYKQATKL